MGCIGIMVAWTTYEIHTIRKKVDNGLIVAVARIDERVKVLWENFRKGEDKT